MKSNAAIEREIEAVLKIINAGPTRIGVYGSRKYAVAFAMYETLQWARGLREQYPSVKLVTLDTRYPGESTNV